MIRIAACSAQPPAPDRHLLDPGRRREALERVAPSYMRINGADARNVIQNSGLPADVLDRLLKSKE